MNIPTEIEQKVAADRAAIDAAVSSEESKWDTMIRDYGMQLVVMGLTLSCLVFVIGYETGKHFH